MKRAIFPGSFDPFTIGHEDVVRRALDLFDEVVIAIGVNAMKKPCFPLEDRIRLIEKAFADEPKVKVMSYTCLTAELVTQLNADYLLRGVRIVADFEYEKQMAEANRDLCGVDTILLYTSPELGHVSSSLVRELYLHGKDVSRWLAPANKA